MRKRDILIFPRFCNEELIQEIRRKYDRLFEKLDAHITLVFPFLDDISDDDLIKQVENILKSHKKFKVRFKGVSLSNDNYIFLNCIEGRDTIIKLHDEIYQEILPNHLKREIEYIPHITLGQSNDISEFSDFTYEFETIIDEICIEEIGDNEESIIVKRITI